MIRKYIVDTRVCPFQADGQFEDGSYFHIRYRNSKVFIGVYPVPTWDRTHLANAFYSESYTTFRYGDEDSLTDSNAIWYLSNFYSKYLEEKTHLSEE